MRLALLLFVLPALAVAQTVTRGPYIQLGTPESMTLVWRTSAPTEGRVVFGTAPGALDRTVTGPAATQHELRLDGLEPSTRYFYAVGTPGKILAGGDEQHFFVTPPPAGPRRRMRLWVVGDSGSGDVRQASVRDAMLRATPRDRPDLMLHLGDMAYTEGTDFEFQTRFFDVYQLVLRNTVCWPTIGNHEGKTSDSATQTGPYYDAYVLPKAGEAGGVPSGTEAWYSFDYAHVHFIVLDSHESSREPTGAMLEWLKRDLAANQKEWTIAYFHHPPYSKGSHDSDVETQLIEMREHALPILEEGGVDLVLAGHSHVYERSWLIDGAYETPSVRAHLLDEGDGKPLSGGAYRKEPGRAPHKGAVYVVAGHGGAGMDTPGSHPLMYMTEKAFGSSIIDIDEDRLTLFNLRADGVQSDRFTLMKADGLVVVSPDGGESLRAGATHELRWATEGDGIENVRIDFSPDHGATWQTVAANVANTGRHEWTVPSTATRHGLVRISDASNAERRDVSDASFVVHEGAADPGDPNQTPVFVPTGVIEERAGRVIFLQLRAADPDGDPLAFSMTDAPEGAELRGNSFTWLPTLEQAGVHAITFEAADGRGGVVRDVATFRLADEDGVVPAPEQPSAPTAPVEGGCGCGAADAGALALALALVALRRRRAR